MDLILKNWPTILIAVTTYILAPVFRNWVSFSFAIKKDDRARRQKLFEEYSKRYTFLLSALLEQTNDFQGNFNKENPKLRSSILKFFMLISEEHYLYSEKLIDRDIWIIWNDGVKFHMGMTFFQEGWSYARKQMDFDGPFCIYIESQYKNKESHLDVAS